MRPERVFIDTNVLLSGLAFDGKQARVPDRGLKHEVLLVLCDRVLLEARSTGIRKFPRILTSLEDFLDEAACEFVSRPEEALIERARSVVRDPKDVEILASILASKPDVALTGDKDLLTVEVKALAPVCTCAEYLARLNLE